MEDVDEIWEDEPEEPTFDDWGDEEWEEEEWEEYYDPTEIYSVILTDKGETAKVLEILRNELTTDEDGISVIKQVVIAEHKNKRKIFIRYCRENEDTQEWECGCWMEPQTEEEWKDALEGIGLL